MTTPHVARAHAPRAALRSIFGVTMVIASLAGLASGCDEDTSARALGFPDHDEPRDLEPVDGSKFDEALESFDRNLVITDAMFVDTTAVTVAGIQALLEQSPYDKRSFLADETVGGLPFSQVLVEVATAQQVNPIMLLARLQVEKSLVSKSNSPGGNAVDFAMGCGCPDNQACNEAYRGIDKQLECAAKTLRTHYDGSVAGTGAWQKGVAKQTLDPLTVTPLSHATASLYAYTPWVLPNTGGNWLVWNVSRKYVGAMLDAGTYGGDQVDPEQPDAPVGSCAEACGTDSAVQLGDGQACYCDVACVENGDCCDDYGAVCGGDDGSGDGGSGDGGSGDDGGGDDGGPAVASCADACGSGDPIDVGDGTECFCDEVCAQSGDCCFDYAQQCGADPEPAAGSCEAACGSGDPIDAGDGTECYCDSYCADNGDCCGDFDAQCG